MPNRLQVGALPLYRNTQSGTVIRVTMLATVILFLVLSLTMTSTLLLTLVLLILALALFHSLTTEVTNDSIVIWFGVGLIRRTIAIAQVKECVPVRNPWYIGWGIRLVPGVGWLWNVSGFDSVELEYVNGKRFRIGTDEPEELAAAIMQAVAGKKDTDPA
jgi:hypothetical protein